MNNKMDVFNRLIRLFVILCFSCLVLYFINARRYQINTFIRETLQDIDKSIPVAAGSSTRYNQENTTFSDLLTSIIKIMVVIALFVLIIVALVFVYAFMQTFDPKAVESAANELSIGMVENKIKAETEKLKRTKNKLKSREELVELHDKLLGYLDKKRVMKEMEEVHPGLMKSYNKEMEKLMKDIETITERKAEHEEAIEKLNSGNGQDG